MARDLPAGRLLLPELDQLLLGALGPLALGELLDDGLKLLDGLALLSDLEVDLAEFVVAGGDPLGKARVKDRDAEVALEGLTRAVGGEVALADVELGLGGRLAGDVRGLDRAGQRGD